MLSVSSRLLRAAALCALGLLPIACSGPRFVADPESGIELRWPRGDGSFEEAQAKAQTRCPGREQHAALAALFMDRDETLARFYCR